MHPTVIIIYKLQIHYFYGDCRNEPFQIDIEQKCVLYVFGICVSRVHLFCIWE